MRAPAQPTRAESPLGARLRGDFQRGPLPLGSHRPQLAVGVCPAYSSPSSPLTCHVVGLVYHGQQKSARKSRAEVQPLLNARDAWRARKRECRGSFGLGKGRAEGSLRTPSQCDGLCGQGAGAAAMPSLTSMSPACSFDVVSPHIPHCGLIRWQCSRVAKRQEVAARLFLAGLSKRAYPSDFLPKFSVPLLLRKAFFAVGGRGEGIARPVAAERAGAGSYVLSCSQRKILMGLDHFGGAGSVRLSKHGCAGGSEGQRRRGAVGVALGSATVVEWRFQRSRP